MDLIEFHCPACQTVLSVSKEAASASGPCPTCGVVINGPGVSPQAGPPPTTPPEEPSPSLPPASAPPSAQANLSTSTDPSAPSSPLPQAGAPPAYQPYIPLDPYPPQAVYQRRRGLGLSNLIALYLLGVVLSLVIGYQAGQRSISRKIAPTMRTDRTPALPLGSSELPSVAGSSTDLLAHLPSASPPSPEKVPKAPPSSPAQSTLLAFLSAPDWSSRLVHVLHSDHLIAEMETTAQREGDGPIPYTSIVPLQEDKETQVFQVHTKRYPDGFPVALAKKEDHWLVDWIAFSEFYYDTFRKFARGPSGLSGTFRLLIRPDDSNAYAFFVSPPTPGNTLMATVWPDSSAHKQLKSIIETLSTDSPAQYDMILQAGGVPLIIQLNRYSENGADQLVIEKVIAKGWIPRKPSGA